MTTSFPPSAQSERNILPTYEIPARAEGQMLDSLKQHTALLICQVNNFQSDF